MPSSEPKAPIPFEMEAGRVKGWTQDDNDDRDPCRDDVYGLAFFTEGERDAAAKWLTKSRLLASEAEHVRMDDAAEYLAISEAMHCEVRLICAEHGHNGLWVDDAVQLLANEVSRLRSEVERLTGRLGLALTGLDIAIAERDAALSRARAAELCLATALTIIDNTPPAGLDDRIASTSAWAKSARALLTKEKTDAE